LLRERGGSNINVDSEFGEYGMESGTGRSSASELAALEATTVCEAFQVTAEQNAERVALRTPGGAVELTFAEYADRVRKIAAGLYALGVRRGETVGLMLLNRPEFNLCDCAAMHLGAIPFSIYNTSSPEQIAYLFGNAGNRVVVTERQFLDAIEASGVDTVEHVISVDDAPGVSLPLADVERADPAGFDFEAAWRAIEPDDLITLCYTSGTTGPPKGVQLTHANLLAEARAVIQVLDWRPGDRITSYLPHAHMADRFTAHYALMCFGQQVTVVDDPRAIVAALADARPTIWGAVPRVWEKIKAALEAQGITDPPALSEEQRAAVRAKLGLAECRWAIAGAAPTAVEVLEYFAALGLPICEVWGMSELTCIATCNPPGRVKLGTVGPPIPGVEVKLADDGELLCRGPIRMTGYRNDPDRSAEAIDSEGWLHTGDVAEIDEDGYVTVVDRKKELIINAAGKNMSPANIEARLKSSSALIGQACAIGDRRPYNVALIVLDPDVCTQWAAEHGLTDSSPALLATAPGVREQVSRGVEQANSHLSRVEQIKHFTILPTDWLPGGDELTPTMKLKRKPIGQKYATEIEALYTG
jgi:long-subunit acyl-CoA synthetase (AMP-forming)